MSKQQNLKVHRNYLKEPRHMTEFDPDHRSDYVEDCVSLTKQSDAESADINNIVQKYLQTGVAPGMAGDPIYGDFDDVVDFQAALDIVARGNAQFAGLEANVRSRFNNDPAQFLEFVNDPSNGEEMVKMGLAEINERPKTAFDKLTDAREKAKPKAPAPDSGASKA